MRELNEEVLHSFGYVAVRQVGDQWLGVLPMTFGKGRLCAGLSWTGHEDMWCYETLVGALEAMQGWNPDDMDEPSGWFRHPVTGRRRPDGNPANEYIAL